MLAAAASFGYCLRVYPDPALHRISEQVPAVTGEIRALAGAMLEIMYANKGVGLAAPQIGVHKRVIVFDIAEKRNDPCVLVNPEIVEASGEQIAEEGCLCFPEIQEKTRRYAKVRCVGLGLDGKELAVEGEDLHARVLQHEIDHLDGILFIERVIPEARQRLALQLEKLVKAKKNAT
jgi:peptide deformylase